MKRVLVFFAVFISLSSSLNLYAQTPFIVAKESDPAITTHEITSGGVTLGITDKGGGMINKFELPGYGDFMGPESDKYGRGGQTAIRSFAHSGKYNPTQAGLTDNAGTQCNITATSNKLIIDERPCCLWRADGSYDFIEWENLASDNYSTDGGSSGYNSDVDSIDESSLSGMQAAEITSEFDFYGFYENCKDINGVDIPCFYSYYEFSYDRYPGHCISQFSENSPVYNHNFIQDDISNLNPNGTHQGTDMDMNFLTHWSTIRFDNVLFPAQYRHYVDAAGNWITEARNSVLTDEIHLNNTNIYPMMIISNNQNINQGVAIGVFQPNSEIVSQQTVGGTYTDDRRVVAWVQDDPSRTPTMMKLGFGGRTSGLLNRNRTPNNDPETWRGEMYYLVGTPEEIYANTLRLTDVTLSIETNTMKNYRPSIKVFPNPVESGKINVKIHDITGKLTITVFSTVGNTLIEGL